VQGPIANRPQLAKLPHKAAEPQPKRWLQPAALAANSSMAVENALAYLFTNKLKHIPQCAQDSLLAKSAD
jgi:hypothetical protein